MILGGSESGLTVAQVLRRTREFLKEVQQVLPEHQGINTAAYLIDVSLQDGTLPEMEVTTYEHLVSIVQFQDVDLRSIEPFPDEEM
jgi:hypothetical protein